MDSVRAKGAHIKLRLVGRGARGPIPIQPTPIQTLVSRLDGITTVARVWAPGDSRRCRLCSECSADYQAGVCLISTTREIAPGEASFFGIIEERPSLRVLDQAEA